MSPELVTRHAAGANAKLSCARGVVSCTAAVKDASPLPADNQQNDT